MVGRSSLPAFAYVAPTTVHFAPDALGRLGDYLRQLGVERALLVCDERLAAHGTAGKVAAASEGRIAHTFSRVQPDAPLDVVLRGAEEARRAEVDGVVAVGGGSSIDTGKAIALLVRHGGDLLRWEGVDKVGARGLPMIAIPTTAGTGSEASNSLVVKDTVSARKVTVLDTAVYPWAAILDPRLTVDLPVSLTAATGIDALTHAVEGVVSVLHQPICDAIGLECVRLIHAWLPRAIRDRADLDARGWMLLSATMAGQLVSMTFNGVAHAIAHALGVGWGVHHGTGNAIALPWSIRFNARSPEAAAMYARCADAWGLRRASDDVAATYAFADAVEEFVAELGLPTRLRAVQLSAADLPRVAELAFADPAHRPNPIPVTSAFDIEAALKNLA